MALQTLSDQQLKDFSEEHLMYELWMLLETRNQLKRPGAEVGFYNNLLVNSWGLALRNILDFFFCSAQDDDVVARHYVPTWQVPMPPSLREAKSRTNKELAHLTTKRIAGTPDHKAWDVDAISDELRLTVREFLRQADPGRLHPDVASLFARI
ncbi:MAG: hypothetical protein JNK87_18160 [Bryobacterales bacterium]|nr:hypothetical protein [Bryobacterales bacterium]